VIEAKGVVGLARNNAQHGDKESCYVK
jgi:hypothetical protein